LDKAVELLEHEFRQLFEEADTRKPVTRSRRSTLATRRAAQTRK
jgi:hypothetical protein